MKNPLKIVWIVLGFLCLGLGTIGIVLPILPTVQDYRNGNSSHGNRLYLHEECAGWKNLYRSGVGMPYPVFLLEGKDSKTGRN